jgi:hypothetical protein
MAKKNNNNDNWIIGSISLIFLVFIIFYKYINVDKTKQNKYEYDDDDDDNNNKNITQNNIIITDNNPVQLQKQNIIDIDETFTKYLNFKTLDNLYEYFDNIPRLDVSLNYLDIDLNLPNKVLLELYNDLLLSIPIKIKNKIINCQTQINNKLLIKQNVLCILSQFFYWWIEEINIPENNSIIEKNMLLILLILFLINDDKNNIKDIVKYNSNDKTVEFISSNFKQLLENVLNVNINTYIKFDNNKQYHREFLVQNEKDQNYFIDKIKKKVNNSYTTLQKYPTIKIRTTNELNININYLNSNLNNNISFDDLIRYLFPINIQINKIYNKLNIFNKSINYNIFSKDDTDNLKKQIISILNQLNIFNYTILEVYNKAKIVEIKKNYNQFIDTSNNIYKKTICTTEYKPVCSINNITYNNKCEAKNIKILYNRPCDKDYILINDNKNDPNTIILDHNRMLILQNLPNSIKNNIKHMSDCSSNIDYVCGINNQTYDNSCKANVAILHKGKCNTIEEDSKNKSKAIASFKESLNNIKNIIHDINKIQEKFFIIIKKYNETNNNKQIFDSNIILPNTISITYFIQILKKLFILSRSSVNTNCNCIYDDIYDYKFVHTDYITNYLI